MFLACVSNPYGCSEGSNVDVPREEIIVIVNGRFHTGRKQESTLILELQLIG